MTESNPEPGYTVVNLTIRIVVIALTLVGNSLVLVTLRKSENFSQVTRHLIGHVAVADILFGVSTTIYSFLIYVGARSCGACLAISVWINLTSGLCSCWGVSLIFLDVYLSVRRQSPAQPGLCLQKARWCIVSVWVLTVAYSLVFVVLKTPTTVTETTVKSDAFKNSSLAFAGFVVFVMVVTAVLMILTFVTI